MKKQAVISKMPLQEGMDDTRVLGGAPVSQSSTPLCCRWALEVGTSPFHPEGVREGCSAAAFPHQEQHSLIRSSCFAASVSPQLPAHSSHPARLFASTMLQVFGSSEIDQSGTDPAHRICPCAPLLISIFSFLLVAAMLLAI